MTETLTANSSISHYRIVSKIGAGGMGKVYRARDEKLNCDVAIEVLPASFSREVDRLRRFEQEAQAAGTLKHLRSMTSWRCFNSVRASRSTGRS